MPTLVTVWGIPYDIDDVDDQIKILKIAKDNFVDHKILNYIERTLDESVGTIEPRVGVSKGSS